MVPDRSILVAPLEKLPADNRDALGIHQSDIVLRTAIVAGLADLRANPDILDYVFASLPKDPLTFREYGERSVQEAKEWFLNTDIPVMMSTRVDENVVPCITISLLSSAEDTASIGDVHYQTAEPGADKLIVYADRFSPTSYDPETGECMVPVELGSIFPGMVLLDSVGRRHVIHEVWDDRVILDPGFMDDFGASCKIVSVHNTVVSLESLQFKESFQVTCHAPNEPVILTYLHSVVVFILLRYKEELIEARGLERTTISSGEIYLNVAFTANIVFSRPITVIGYVRNYWPKAIKRPIEGLQVSVIPNAMYRLAVRGSAVIRGISHVLGGVETPNVSVYGTALPGESVSLYKQIENGEVVLVAVATADSDGNWAVENIPANYIS